ncbi:MAG: helix-turn-helix transcriptional regulator [Caldilineaceae bacterium]
MDAPDLVTLRAAFVAGATAQVPTLPTLSDRRQAKLAYDGLTAREREVAALVAQGLSNRAIAEALTLSERTAERHVANIMAKLGCNSRAQIAAWAARKQL